MASRLERGLRILLRLQHGVKYDAMKLAAEMSVTRRTIFRDIALLKNMGIPITFDVDSGHYTLQPPNLDVSSADGSSPDLDSSELARLLKTVIGDNTDSDESIRRIASAYQATPTGTATTSDQRPTSDVGQSSDAAESGSPGRSSFRVHRPDTIGESKSLPEPLESFCCAITLGEPICILDQSEGPPGSELRIVPLQLTFAGAEWRINGTTLASEPISLLLRQIQIISDENVAEHESPARRQETCN